MERITESQILKAPHLNGARLSADIGNLMVLAPHPDDESLGCGGLISMLRQKGSQVAVIFITSGSASHPNSKTHPPDVLSQIRESEAIGACSELGVTPDNIHFVRARDSGLEQLDRDALSEMSQDIVAMFENRPFSALAVPWRRDPHPDHRVVHTLGDMILEKISKEAIKIEYPIWLWKNGKEDDWPTIGETVPYRLDISKVFPQKWKAVKQHKSQLGEIIKDDEYGFVLTGELLEPFNKNMEFFFVTALRDLKTLDAAYFERLYSDQEDPWDFRNSEYERKKYQRSLEVLEKETFSLGLELGCSIGIQTQMLSKVCQHLMAVDISEAAVKTASDYCYGTTNIEFRAVDITTNFPHGFYDLITCCEIGYYLEDEDLEQLFRNIKESLLPNGKLLMVHWTAFVPDYPQSGDTVHDRFERFAEETEVFNELVHQRHENYRLQVWRKSAEDGHR